MTKTKTHLASRPWILSAVSVVCLMALSCTSSEAVQARGSFREVYRPAPPPERQQYERQTLRVDFDGIPLWLAAHKVATQYNVSVAVSDQARLLPVAGTFSGATVSEVMAGIAASVGLQTSKTGRAYFLGNQQSTERASLVRPVMNADPETVVEALRSLDDFINATISPQGVVIVTGTWTAVAEAEVLLSSLEAVEISRWIVQLVFLEVTDQAAEELALKVTPSADVALRLATNATNAAEAAVALEAVLQASAEVKGVETVAEPLLVLLEGETGELVIGERFPIRNRAVSDQGTVTDRDVSFVQTGLQIAVTVTTSAEDAARMQLEFSRSDATGVSDGIPVVATQTFRTTADLEVGGVYLVGSLDIDEQQRTGMSWLNWGQARSHRKSRVQVWAKVHRYSAGVRENGEIPKLSVGHSVLSAMQSGEGTAGRWPDP